MICANSAWTLRVSASTSGRVGVHVGERLELADQVGVGRDRLRRGATRWRPPTRIWSVPSGILIILWTTAIVPTVVDVVEARRLDRGVAGGDEREQPVAGDDVVDQPDRALLPDRERRHRLREDDRVLERRIGSVAGSSISASKSSGISKPRSVTRRSTTIA